MLNIPEWQKILIEISKGRNKKSSFKSNYTKSLLYELESQKFIKIENDNIIILEKGFKIVDGVVFGFLEQL